MRLRLALRAAKRSAAKASQKFSAPEIFRRAYSQLHPQSERSRYSRIHYPVSLFILCLLLLLLFPIIIPSPFLFLILPQTFVRDRLRHRRRCSSRSHSDRWVAAGPSEALRRRWYGREIALWNVLIVHAYLL